MTRGLPSSTAEANSPPMSACPADGWPAHRSVGSDRDDRGHLKIILGASQPLYGACLEIQSISEIGGTLVKTNDMRSDGRTGRFHFITPTRARPR